MTSGLSERSFGELPAMTVCRLTVAEQFVVGACRCWDAFQLHPDPLLAWRELEPVFAYMNVSAALCAFGQTFDVLRRHRLRALIFQEGDCERLCTDEARLLYGVASLQRGQVRPTVRILTGALTRCGIQAVLPPLARIAAILDVRGHRLPAWRDAPIQAVPIQAVPIPRQPPF
jgi:hypothetical protein